MSFDPLNILLLAIALVVFWRLKSVLGTRTGHERPPVEPFDPKQAEPAAQAEQNGKVIRFPDTGRPEQAPANTDEPPPPAWTGYADAGSPLATNIERLAAADPAFTPKGFIEGAKLAYEMILEAFAKGDKPALKGLLAPDVYDGFASVIDARQKSGQRVETRFVGIEKTKLLSVVQSGDKAAITVEFLSELISATYDAGGRVVEGDPAQIREVTDVWTFERDITSRNPNWKLSATQAPA